MTNDEAKTLLIEQGAKMVDARVRGYEAETWLERAAREWRDAATELAEALNDCPDVPAADQYECFVTACQLAGVDPEHPALEDERESFKAMQSGLN